ncbi:helix-turn-helix domain-containing protein [Gordonia pseudamarae]|uniref:helix-turn-helix transcriptional regulator n=1 Tax=Gordonia TaxID=2053 RepID=UPI0019C1697D|nr:MULTISPECIES: helix-turn-helix domain-containing protein [Gordonia]MBD0021937.1 helix-turn-helix domain-containing protein [Gordonia sp. (in: high G+C Gram-positive bacteria)]QHN28042.1 helix-turn-helix domain-containing protein [Gordonia pseudamarae]
MTTTPVPATALLTERQAADLLGIHKDTLRVWRYRGRGPAHVRLGTSTAAGIRYRRADLDTWIDQHVQEG